MDVFRRVTTFLVITGRVDRAIALCTIDDEQDPQESHIKEIIKEATEPLRGLEVCKKIIRQTHGAWTWKVVLKCLSVYLRIMTARELSPDYIKHHLNGLDVFEIFGYFREGEGSDMTALFHTGIIRSQARFLLAYRKLYLAEPQSPLYKDKQTRRMLTSISAEELHSNLSDVLWILELGLLVFPRIEETKNRFDCTHFCNLTAYNLRHVLMSVLSVYTAACSLVNVIIHERFYDFDETEVPYIVRGYTKFAGLSDFLSKVIRALSKLPKLNLVEFPIIETMPPACLAFQNLDISDLIFSQANSPDIFYLNDSSPVDRSDTPTVIGSIRNQNKFEATKDSEIEMQEMV